MERREIYCLIALCIIVFPASMIEVQSVEIPEIFSISLLRANVADPRQNWALNMELQLPKIGIGVDFHESTSWSNVALRTWDYPLIDFDYIPTYAEGGFDLLFMNYLWDLDWNPSRLFDTGYPVTIGGNFYQYANPVYDSLLINYLSELDQNTHINYGKQLQAILYEDLPSIATLYERSLYGFKEGLTGIDALLLSTGADRYEYWDDPSDHIIKYAIPTDLDEYNSYIQDNFYDKLWMQGIYGSLFKREQTTRLWEPQIASDIFISEDNLNVTINLDPNAKFSDGSPVLAEDVEYSYELHMTPAVGSSYYWNLNKWLASNDSISTVGADTVTFNLSQTNAFMYNLFSYGIVDKSEVQPAISTYGYSIVNEIPLTGNVSDTLVKSCGPFKLDTYNQTTSTVKLVPNTYYSELLNYDSPLLDEWQMMFISGKDTAVAELITGNVDIVDAQYYPQIADFTPTGVEGVLVKGPLYQELAVNMKHPVFGTGELTPLGTPQAAKYVRKAISHVIPRALIADEVYDGLAEPATTACPDMAVVYDDTLQPYAYDLDLALEYMDYNWDIDPPTTTTGTPSETSNGFTKTIGDNWIISIVLLSLIGLTITQIIRKRKMSS